MRRTAADPAVPDRLQRLAAGRQRRARSALVVLGQRYAPMAPPLGQRELDLRQTRTGATRAARPRLTGFSAS